MNQDTTKSKRPIIIVGIILGGLVIAALAFFLVVKILHTTQKPAAVSSTAQREELVKKGREAENKGDTQAALDKYKAALALCAQKDDLCKANINTKINIMNSYLQTEKETQSQNSGLTSLSAEEP